MLLLSTCRGFPEGVPASVSGLSTISNIYTAAPSWVALCLGPGKPVVSLRPLLSSGHPVSPSRHHTGETSWGLRVQDHSVSEPMVFGFLGGVNDICAHVFPPWKGPGGLVVCVLCPNLTFGCHAFSLPSVPSVLPSSLHLSWHTASSPFWNEEEPLASSRGLRSLPFSPPPQHAAPGSGPQNVLRSGKKVDMGDGPSV